MHRESVKRRLEYEQIVAGTRSLNNLIVFRNSQGEQARGSLLKVSRSTLIFEVYNPYSIVQLSEVLQEVEIRSGERIVYNGRAVVINLVNTGLMLIVSASLVDPWSELIGLMGDSETIREEVEGFIAEWQGAQVIRPGYQLAVSRIRSFLTELNRWIEHLDVEEAQQSQTDDIRVSDELFDDLAEPLLPTLSELFLEFEEEAGKVEEEERMRHMRYAQYDLHPLLMRAPFVYRAYHKPLGYAGDYEMVNMMLREAREGPTIYTQIINTLYLGTGPARAHRNRIDVLVSWLRENIARVRAAGRRPRILNIGCGPAIELQRMVATDPEMADCEITLIDFSQETLDYTRGRLEEASAKSRTRPEIFFVHDSVHGLLKQASQGRGKEKTEPYDIIYCAGLFDYLSERICGRLIRLFSQWAAGDGEIMVTNVHPSNPARNWMEHLLEWYLIYRDEAAMESLADPYPRHQIFRDETGVNIFLRIRKERCSTE